MYIYKLILFLPYCIVIPHDIFTCFSCRIMDSDSRMCSAAADTLEESHWQIVEFIMRGSYPFDARTFAFHFYLNACDVVAAKGDSRCQSKFTDLANYVETVLQTMFQHYGITVEGSRKFGCANSELFGQEFAVSRTYKQLLSSDNKYQCANAFCFLQVWMKLLTPRYSECIESSWHQACTVKLSERLSKVCNQK